MPKARRFAAAWALATPWLAFIASDRSASRLALHAKKGPDVRALLESAGLLPPKPTETWLPEARGSCSEGRARVRGEKAAIKKRKL